ncbi:hypothetical protein ASZ78_003524 [Callipepla squamata]|uniref:FAM161 centrosomal protein B n=1 Tax=Callipepla squamata TaxID=9009 RepID=A0A226NH52_CALSU|nr:hypothetical protein ASZ78_003524 [Callipepla squamata]
MEGRRSLLELGLLCQAALGSELSSSQEDEDLGDFLQEAAALRARLCAVLSHTSGNKRQSCSLIDLTSDSTWDQQKPHLFPKPRLRPKSASSPWIPSITIPQPFKMTLREAHKKSQLMKSNMFLELDKLRDKRQSQDEAECQKQFRAQPVPAHVFLPLYHEIMEQNEVRRQIATQKRKELLLSTQRPFSFLEKEEKKKEAIRQKFLAAATPKESSKLKKVNRKVPRSTNDTLLGDKLKEAELYREIRIQMRAKDLLESSVAPIDTSNCRRDPQSRTATKTKQERLGFLQDRSFSFKPRINPTVPDFEELYWEFQREAVRRQEIKEATQIKPFKLRTSNLRCRQREANEKCILQMQQEKGNLLLGRGEPVLDMDIFHFRQNMRERTREYRKELEEMQLRVSNRPYLFEQVTKHDARRGAERRYRNTLQQVGLSEEFVRKKGKDAADLLEEESDIHR